MIEFDRVTKKYGKLNAIDDLSFEIDKNGLVALLGPNGAGKTTVLKCIVGLVSFNGKITVDGLDARKNGVSVRRKVAYLPQQFSLYNHLNVEDNMEFFAGINGIDRETVKKGLEEYGLKDHVKKRIMELSEGLRQRLMLATTLLGDNPVLLFDEPTANLDIRGVLEFKETVDRLSKRGKTIILSTHLLSDVKEIANHAIVINRGKMVIEGPVDEILKKVHLNPRILITLSEELKSGVIDSITASLIRAGAKKVSTEREYITVSVETANKIPVLKAIDEAGLIIKDFRIFEPSLEEAFLEITSGERR